MVLFILAANELTFHFLDGGLGFHQLFFMQLGFKPILVMLLLVIGDECPLAGLKKIVPDLLGLGCWGNLVVASVNELILVLKAITAVDRVPLEQIPNPRFDRNRLSFLIEFPLV